MRKKLKKQNPEKLIAVESNTLVDVKQDEPTSSTHIEKSRKSVTKHVLLAMLALVVVVSVSMYAWAKYKSSLQGDVNSQIAVWSFKVKLGETNTIDVLNFPETRTDGNTLVDSNTIAPRNKWKIPNRYRC